MKKIIIVFIFQFSSLGLLSDDTKNRATIIFFAKGCHQDQKELKTDNSDKRIKLKSYEQYKIYDPREYKKRLQIWKYKTFKILADKGAKSHVYSEYENLKCATQKILDDIYHYLCTQEENNSQGVDEEIEIFWDKNKKYRDGFFENIKDEMRCKSMQLGGTVITRSYKIFLALDYTLDKLVADIVERDEFYHSRKWANCERENLKNFFWGILVAGITDTAPEIVLKLYNDIKSYILLKKNEETEDEF